MEDIKLVKITDWNPIGVRTIGQLKNRWRDEVKGDLVKLRYWSQLVKDGKSCNDLVQKTETHGGLKKKKYN
jgi:hypothetical protein